MLVALLVAAVATFLVFEWLEAQALPTLAALPRSDRGFAFLSGGLLTHRAQGGALTQLHGACVGGRMATSAAYQADGSLLYFYLQDECGTLARRPAGGGGETILLREPGLHLVDLCLSPDGQWLAASALHVDGGAGIVLLRADGSGLRRLTAGDTCDRAPAWIPRSPNRLLFQTTPLVRDARGTVIRKDRASLRLLNPDGGATSVILSQPRFDLLKPRVDPAGNLLFIRRLPLAGTEAPGRVVRRLLGGRAGAAHRPLYQGQLVCRGTDGYEQVLATGVASYDVGADGTIVYSTGCSVIVLEADGAARIALTQPRVAEVIAAWP